MSLAGWFFDDGVVFVRTHGLWASMSHRSALVMSPVVYVWT
jgi:hypothetical protein